MDGQNFQDGNGLNGSYGNNSDNGSNGFSAEPTPAEPVVTEPYTSPYQNNTDQSGSFQSSTYQSNTYQDNTAQYSDPVYSTGNTGSYNNSADPYAAAPAESGQTPGVSVASLILGIAGIPLSCCCGVGFILGIIGLILGLNGNKKSKTGVGTAGIVCSVIAIVFGLIGLAYYLLVGGAAMMESL